MQIEVVEFYPSQEIKKITDVTGSLSVYIIDMEMDLRGVIFQRKNNRIYISSPVRFYKEEETGRLRTYPVITFTDPEKQKDFTDSLIAAVKAFMVEYLSNFEKGLMQKKSSV